MKKTILASLVACFCVGFNLVAQTPTFSTSESVQPDRIPSKDMMYKKTVWRTIDLREKQNKPLFAFNNEITKILVEAVRRGDLPVYKNDSLISRLSSKEFFANMTMVEEGNEPSPEEIRLGFTRQEDDDWKRFASANVNSNETKANEFLPRELYLLEIKEDAIFDKKRSRMYHEIQSLTLIVPASLKTNLRNRDIIVGSFKYVDLVKVFHLYKADAFWINPRNDAENKNLAEAFELRLFSSFITKVSNPDNASLEDLYKGPGQGLLASQQKADKMLEFEYNLWSF
ncbi:type IX secretion system ring subunit PorN/GldN [Adhaeribacter soli]|uniref:Gliding motility protein GldN n=1 Tax=Adhaeribacter soli TaxID=2607655 RepID=A0A5N1IQY3_9BACT|nr:gliding motility protein GldN [Adhaeribacter soli]KAA9331935.1 gliding motility protein GldN [Adhaeribacter soli]